MKKLGFINTSLTAIGVGLMLLSRPMPSLADAELSVDTLHPSHAISPVLYGLMTEEINHSYDGGLYAELIQNRSFKDNPDNPWHWALVEKNGSAGAITLDKENILNAAQNVSLKLTASNASAMSPLGVSNDGYWGIPVKPGTTYRASFYAKADKGFNGPLYVSIETADGKTVWAQAQAAKISGEWKKYTVTLKTDADIKPSVNNRFMISMQSPGAVWLSLVSLFPPTYNNRANGNRMDIMEKLAGLHPSFLRFPGGNFVEGNNANERYEWKKTIGDISDRPGHQGTWFYRTSDGMGLLEFLEWCEDLHMQPVLAVFAGFTFDRHYVTGKELEPIIQEALDEIEYVTGSKSTKWGAKRAADGHPKPFALNYVEIGNEDFADPSGSYDQRFTQFYDAIKAKYPSLKLIATTEVKSRKPDIMDDHYYRPNYDMQADANHYTNWPADKPKVFVGEWATMNSNGDVRYPAGTPRFLEALGDSVWMTGLERDSDSVVMHCYAPLFVNVNAKLWVPDLIGYDALTSYGSPSYYAQCMFSGNRGDVVLPVKLTQPQRSNDPMPVPTGAIGVGTWDTQAEFKDINVTNGPSMLYSFDPSKPDYKGYNGNWSVKDRSLVQSGGGGGVVAVMGDPTWKNYTFTVRARKTSGNEGFLIAFHAKNSSDLRWCNIGGWGNTQAAVQINAQGYSGILGAWTPFHVETGRWYNIRIVVNDYDIKCYVDDKLVLSQTDTGVPVQDPIYATASKENASGDVIIKVVNIDSKPQPLHLKLDGAGKVNTKAHLIQMSAQPDDTNSIAEPEKVVPVSSVIDNASTDYTQVLPAYSINVIRLSTR